MLGLFHKLREALRPKSFDDLIAEFNNAYVQGDRSRCFRLLRQARAAAGNDTTKLLTVTLHVNTFKERWGAP